MSSSSILTGAHAVHVPGPPRSSMPERESSSSPACLSFVLAGARVILVPVPPPPGSFLTLAEERACLCGHRLWLSSRTIGSSPPDPAPPSPDHHHPMASFASSCRGSRPRSLCARSAFVFAGKIQLHRACLFFVSPSHAVHHPVIHDGVTVIILSVLALARVIIISNVCVCTSCVCVMSRDENGMDIFRLYSRPNPFRGVLIRPYPSPDI
jgi:hypothetical protein